MLKKIKPILIVPGEPNSIFFEILFKSLRTKKFKSPIVLIASHKILKVQMKKFNFKKKINTIDVQFLSELKLNNKCINFININFNKKDTHIYLKNCFDIAFKILKLKITNKFINGPINKSTFLNKKFLGITEYISYNFKREKVAMLIYNEKLSVCPLTTHLPIKIVPKKINAKLIKEKVYLIDSFFKENRNFKPKIAVTGLNPHCESILNFNEDQKIITPAIKKLKKEGYNVYGPFPADTIFLKQNRDNYDVILGMYHDQVLAPIKTIKEYNAINITLGLPFFRISPDHGPNLKMINKNISTPLSLIKSIKFLDQK